VASPMQRASSGGKCTRWTGSSRCRSSVRRRCWNAPAPLRTNSSCSSPKSALTSERAYAGATRALGGCSPVEDLRPGSRRADERVWAWWRGCDRDTRHCWITRAADPGRPGRVRPGLRGCVRGRRGGLTRRVRGPSAAGRRRGCWRWACWGSGSPRW
jgi:hypothetical protein